MEFAKGGRKYGEDLLPTGKPTQLDSSCRDVPVNSVDAVPFISIINLASCNNELCLLQV